MDIETFSARRVATTGHEIITPQGTVVAWAVDATWAAILVALLNKGEPPELLKEL